MGQLYIKGGFPLYGSIRLGGAKNASFKIMIASLLCDSESRLLNLSHIAEVDMVSQVIESLGAKVSKRGERNLFILPKGLKQWRIDQRFGHASRSAPMFLPILLHKFSKAYVPLPGGDKLGNRPIDWHLQALEKMGASFVFKADAIQASCQKLHGVDYTFPKNSHTGTETVIMAAVLAKGKTLIRNAAQEPEIDDLINYLNHSGARIRRRHGRVIEIDGVKSLKGSIYSLMPDRNEAVSYACAALITKGDIIVENARPQDLEAFLEKLSEIKAGFEIGNYGIRFYAKKSMRGADIDTSPHPGFMTDWQPLWAVLATQLKGESIIHETVYPSRFHYVPDLVHMGANITLFNPKVDNPDKTYNFNAAESQPGAFHATKFTGPSKLSAGHFTVKDLRHGATLVLAGLAAKGVTVLDAVEHIDRGYENLDSRLRSMGALISRQPLE